MEPCIYNVNVISLGKIFDTQQDIFGREGEIV